MQGKKHTRIVNTCEGGTDTPKGTKEYQVEKSIIITTAPKSEYEFTDWTVIDGDINIKKQVA